MQTKLELVAAVASITDIRLVYKRVRYLICSKHKRQNLWRNNAYNRDFNLQTLSMWRHS